MRAIMERQIVRVAGFVEPRGYEDALVLKGASEWLVLGGHVAFDASRRILHPNDLLGQFRVALRNLRATLRAAGFEPRHVVKLTIHVTSVDDYRANLKALGAIWKEEFGREYPAMTLLGVSGLMEVGSVVEIDGLAAK